MNEAYETEAERLSQMSRDAYEAEVDRAVALRTAREAAGKPKVIFVPIDDLAYRGCAEGIKRMVNTFPVQLTILFPDHCQSPVHFLVHDKPGAKENFDDFINEMHMKAKRWAQEDARHA